MMKSRDWTIPLGPVRGKAGQKLVVSAEAGIFFKGQILIAITEKKFRVGRKDNGASLRVEAAKIESLIVGTKVAFGLGVESPVAQKGDSYDRFELSDCPIYWPGTQIAVTIEFAVDGEWSGTLIGKAIPWEELLPQIVDAFK